jgi:hypothetical protein
MGSAPCICGGVAAFVLLFISSLLITRGVMINNKNSVYEHVQCLYDEVSFIAYAPDQYNLIVTGIIEGQEMHPYTWAPYPMFSTLSEVIIEYEKVHLMISNGSISTPCIHDPIQDMIVTLMYDGNSSIIGGVIVLVLPCVSMVATFLIVITSQWRRRVHCKRDIDDPHSWPLKCHGDQDGIDEKAEDSHCNSKIACKGFVQVYHSENVKKGENVKKEGVITDPEYVISGL